MQRLSKRTTIPTSPGSPAARIPRRSLSSSAAQVTICSTSSSVQWSTAPAWSWTQLRMAPTSSVAAQSRPNSLMKIRDYAESVGGRVQLAIEGYAKAFETIPRTLAENSGYNPIDRLVALKNAHAKGKKTPVSMSTMARSLICLKRAFLNHSDQSANRSRVHPRLPLC